jgi:hypothetical protein
MNVRYSVYPDTVGDFSSLSIYLKLAPGQKNVDRIVISLPSSLGISFAPGDSNCYTVSKKFLSNFRLHMVQHRLIAQAHSLG